jgi:hypothetical protein
MPLLLASRRSRCKSFPHRQTGWHFRGSQNSNTSLMNYRPSHKSSKNIPGSVESILANLPVLRSLVLRNFSVREFSTLELVSESLETFSMEGKIRCHVSNYRCPKLTNLSFSGYQVYEWGVHHYGLVFEDDAAENSAWDAVQAGVHALDLTTLPASRKLDWCNSGFFAEGVYHEH